MIPTPGTFDIPVILHAHTFREACGSAITEGTAERFGNTLLALLNAER